MTEDDLKNGDLARRSDVLRLEGKVDALLVLMRSIHPSSEDVEEDDTVGVLLPSLTVKQHAALQMLLRGADNQEISERFGVGVNTAKVYVRSLFKRFGVNTRASLILKVRGTWRRVRPDAYQAMAGGLPKDWDERFDEYGKSFEYLYHR